MTVCKSIQCIKFHQPEIKIGYKDIKICIKLGVGTFKQQQQHHQQQFNFSSSKKKLSLCINFNNFLLIFLQNSLLLIIINCFSFYLFLNGHWIRYDDEGSEKKLSNQAERKMYRWCYLFIVWWIHFYFLIWHLIEILKL